MNYSLTYSGQPGNISATLGAVSGSNFKTIATATGLKNGRAARRWAKGEAELHRQAQRSPESRSEHVSVSGNAQFSL